MKNRIVAVCLTLILCIGLLSGCGSDNKNEKSSKETTPAQTQEAKKDKIKVVSTIFPSYDWVKQVIGDKEEQYELTMLLDKGVDLHSYQPTAEDIAKIADCDLFIYVGGESDTWVEDALKEAKNPNRQVINLMEALGDTVKEEEIVEGMQGEEEEEEGEEEEGPEYDEHVWLSLKNAASIVAKIEEALAKIDVQNAEVYKKNADAYVTELKTLDGQYQSAVDGAARKAVLFGDRFPFRYLVDDYGLTYYAAFVGCSAETEASFETITFLAGKVDELKIPVVLVIENSDKKIADAIVQNTKSKDQQVLVMNSLQSVTSEDVKKGVSYLNIMKDNLETLKKVLN